MTELIENQPPRHGYRGESATPTPSLTRPHGLTLAVSREVGSRGGSIARRVAERLGWQLFDQEALDFLTRDTVAREELHADLPVGAKEWAEFQLARLLARNIIAKEADAVDTVGLMLALAARGETVIVGRGAGFVLPAKTTLHIRVVAPFRDRIAYLGDLLRLSPEAAAAEVTGREDRRQEYLSHFVTPTTEATAFDLVLNSGRLGVEASAALIEHLVRDRHVAAGDLPRESPDAA